MPVAVKQVANQKDTTKSGFIGGITQMTRPKSGMKISIYGRSGTGKTTLFSTFPKPALLIRAEEGTESIWKEKGIDTTPLVKRTEDVVDVCEHVRKSGKYKTVCLDTASSFQDIVLAGVIGRRVPVRIGFAEISVDDWGQVSYQMKETLRQLMDLATLGVNVVILSQERDFREEGNASEMLLPTISCGVIASVRKWLDPEVNYIGHTFLKKEVEKVKSEKGRHQIEEEKEKIAFCLRIGPHEIYVTKFRKPRDKVLPDYIVDPTYDKIAAFVD